MLLLNCQFEVVAVLSLIWWKELLSMLSMTESSILKTAQSSADLVKM